MTADMFGIYVVLVYRFSEPERHWQVWNLSHSQRHRVSTAL
jgi:hypothetical protein